MPTPRTVLARVRDWRASRHRRRLADRLLAAGLVDSAYLGVQLGTTFSSHADAAAAWAQTEPRLFYAPHPLIEPAWISERSVSFAKGDRCRSVGPQLSLPGTTAWIEEAAEALARMAPDSMLPAAPGVHAITLAQAVDLAHARAREFARQNAHSLRRNSSSFTEGPRLPSSPVVETNSDVHVSVIMPVRDRAEVVAFAIESVLTQVHTQWELLVIDDGSADSTPAVVEAYAARDSRIRLVRQGPAGVSAARNRGIAEARGELVAFLDSDNTWTPSHLESAVAAVGDGTQRAVHTVVRVRRDDGGLEFAAEQVNREALLEGRNAIDLNALVVGRSVLKKVGGFDESLRRWVDYDLILRLAREVDLQLVPVVGVDYDHRVNGPDRITTRESPLWRRVVLERALVDWAALEAGCPDRGTGFSVVIRSRGRWPETLATVRHLRSLVDVVDVVVVDAASSRAETGILALATAADPAVTILRTAWDAGWSLSVELALAATRARELVAIEPGALPTVVELTSAAERARQAGGAVRTPDGDAGILLAADACSLIQARGVDLLDDPLVSME